MIIFTRFLCLIILVSISGCVVPGFEKSRINRQNELGEQLDRGLAAYREGRMGDAETLLLAVLEKQPELSEAWFKLGNINYRTGRYEASVRAYEKTVYYDRGNGRAWYNLALTRIKQADISIETGLAHVDPDDSQYIQLELLRKKIQNRINQKVKKW